VRAWIILEAEAWALLQANGRLTCPRHLACGTEEFVPAYAWMRDRLVDAGIAPPAENLTPWWCWVQRDGEHPAPFAEDTAGVEVPVVLQLRLPTDAVALSCFDLWHWVLNGWFLPASTAEGDAFNAELVFTGETPAIGEKRRASWARIFDLGNMLGEPLPLEARCIQGCFWELRLSDVVGAATELDHLQREDLEDPGA